MEPFVIAISIAALIISCVALCILAVNVVHSKHNEVEIKVALARINAQSSVAAMLDRVSMLDGPHTATEARARESQLSALQHRSE